mgnify:CR=1 FL=1
MRTVFMGWASSGWEDQANKKNPGKSPGHFNTFVTGKLKGSHLPGQLALQVSGLIGVDDIPFG